MLIEVKKKRLGLGPDDQTISDLERKNKAKARAARVSEEKARKKNKPQPTVQSTQQTLSEVERNNRRKKSVQRAEERKKKFNAKSQSKMAEFRNSDVTVLSDTDNDNKVTISIRKKGIDSESAKREPPQCDEDEPSDYMDIDEQPKPKGKTAGKSTVVRFEEPPKREDRESG